MPSATSFLGSPAEFIPALVVTAVLVAAAVTLVLAALRRRDVPTTADELCEESGPVGARYSSHP